MISIIYRIMCFIINKLSLKTREDLKSEIDYLHKNHHKNFIVNEHKKSISKYSDWELYKRDLL